MSFIDPLPRLMPFDQWQQGTAITLGIRSELLRALDREIQLYERNPTVFRLSRTLEALKAWQDSKGPAQAWKKDARNGNGTVSLLDQQLRGLGDTDLAMGAQAFMAPALVNARLGVLYLFSHTTTDDSIFKVVLDGSFDLTKDTLGNFDDVTGVDTASKVLTGAKLPAGMAAAKVEGAVRSRGGRQVVDSSTLLADSRPPTNSRLRRAYEWIRAKLEEVGRKIWSTIQEKYAAMKADPGGTALDLLPGMLRKLFDFLAGQFIKAVAPVLGGALDLAKGIGNTIDAGVTKFREWLAGRNVQLLVGHPGTMVEAIRRAMWLSVGEGLYDTLKGGAKLGVEIASMGSAGMILGVVTSVLEALVKTIWRIVEIIVMRSFFKQAQTHWAARMERSALHTQPIAFNNWFKRYALNIPVLSVLALNSGICGDKMHFLAMYKDDSSIVSQTEFDSGVRYVDSLKSWGSDYLKDSGFSFASTDSVVTGLLKLATSHAEESGVAAKAWKATLGFLNA
jgi:hypothetical protein